MWLKLQPYRQLSVHHRVHQKVANKFYGPFQVISVICTVVYKLKLPADAKIHDVFHVSQLKAFHSRLPQATHIPAWLTGVDPHDAWSRTPEAILDRRIHKVANSAQTQFLVKWTVVPSEESTWVVAEWFQQHFPTFSIET